MNRRSLSLINSGIVTAVGLIALSNVSAIPIANPGFESDATLDISVGGTMRYNVTNFPDFHDPLAAGWTLLFPVITAFDDRTAVIQDLNNSPYLTHNPDGTLSTTADDNNILGLARSNQVSQALGTTFAPAVDYTLTVRSARLNNQTDFAGGRLILGYGTVTSYTPLAVVTNVGSSAALDTLPDPSPGEWVTIMLNYSTGSSGPELGQNIVVAFAPTDAFPGITSYVDNFTLIPEPSATALVCGALLVWWRRRVH